MELALLWITHSSFELKSSFRIAGLLAVLVSLQFVYMKLRPSPTVGSLAGGLAVIIWAGVVSGVIALTGLRARAPLIDSTLADIDGSLGLDTPAFVAWVARHPFVASVLDAAYVSTVPLVFFTVVVLAVTRRETRLWELCFVFSGTGAFCSFISVALPAVGAFTHYRIAPDILSHLPSGAGLFYLPIFDGYRSGLLEIVDIRHIEGVVTFPSFHACMALMIAFALRDTRSIRAFAWLWSLVILISTIPIGGHYVSDLIAGAVVWAIFSYRRLWTNARPAPGMAIIGPPDDAHGMVHRAI